MIRKNALYSIGYYVIVLGIFLYYIYFKNIYQFRSKLEGPFWINKHDYTKYLSKEYFGVYFEI